jgi:hypothetical protein
MRTRLAIVLTLTLVLAVPWAGTALAGDGHLITDSNVIVAQDPGPLLLAQETGEDPGEANVGEEEEAEQTGGEEEDGGAAEESGAGEEETGGGATETGPPWTYQMARVALVLTVLLGIGIALMYRKLVGTRQRV